ncbi:MAG: site-2 protease family protein, partial [Muribaculaceae bacterium]
ETIQQIGLRNGDIILKVNDMEVDPASTGDMWEMVQDGSRITVMRNHADTLTFTMTQPVLEQLMAENQRFMAMRLPVIVKDVQGGKGAAQAGILPGDRIVAVNSDTVPSLSEFVPLLANYKDTLPTMSILRNNQLMRIPVAVDSDGKIGILLTTNAYEIYDFKEVQYGFFASIPHGWTLAVDQLTTYASSLKMLFTKSGAQSVGGFGTLGSLFPTSWNWYAFWNIAALLSIILAFMNFLPIPALDGGYILFLVWEVITRRRVPDKFLERANTVGMALLFLLLVYANINDIYRLIIK